MKKFKLKFKVQNLCYKNSEQDVDLILIEFIPGIAFRRVKFRPGWEYNFYFTWLIWEFSLNVYSREDDNV